MRLPDLGWITEEKKTYQIETFVSVPGIDMTEEEVAVALLQMAAETNYEPIAKFLMDNLQYMY